LFFMRRLTLLLLCVAVCYSAEAATGRVIKVLPHLLDLKGRHALSPSLYERDAYQAYLREHPEEQSGVRFDVQWKARGTAQEALRLRVEVRGVARGSLPKQLVIERAVKSGWWSRWSGLTLDGRDFEELGDVTAWRVTLWDNNQLLGEQKSFLW
jgi:hypothetical protein